MEVQQLRYALAVIDEGTFTAAARACFVAQPSLSQSVRNLERELGADLFQRIGRRVVVTSAGQAFALTARQALRDLDTVRAAVQSVADVVEGHLDVVALPTLAASPVSPLIAAFRTVHPRVVVRLSNPDDTLELMRFVADGSSEVGITELPAGAQHPGSIVVHALGRQEIVAVLPPGSNRRRSMTAAALAATAIVAQTVGTSTRGMLDRFLLDAGVAPAIAVETDQREAIVPLVLAGAGTALLPRPMAAAAAAQGAVLVSLVPALWRPLALIHRDAPLSPAARAFVRAALAA